MDKSIDSKNHKLYNSKILMYEKFYTKEEDIRVSRK